MISYPGRKTNHEFALTAGSEAGGRAWRGDRIAGARFAAGDRIAGTRFAAGDRIAGTRFTAGT